MLWFFTCFVGSFYIHEFIYLQTIGLRYRINFESNPLPYELHIISCMKLCESRMFSLLNSIEIWEKIDLGY
jgi:hypothetical protein